MKLIIRIKAEINHMCLSSIELISEPNIGHRVNHNQTAAQTYHILIILDFSSEISLICACTTLTHHHHNQQINLAIKKIFKLVETAKSKYPTILRRIVIRRIFFLQYLSDNLPKTTHQISIQMAAQDTIIQTLEELPQSHSTKKGIIGKRKLKLRISRKIEKSRIRILLFIKSII